jgi:hypothetical protein
VRVIEVTSHEPQRATSRLLAPCTESGPHVLYRKPLRQIGATPEFGKS